jgi:hypothetical protein
MRTLTLRGFLSPKGSEGEALGMYGFSAVFCPCKEMLGQKSKLLSSAITSPGIKERSSNFSANLDAGPTSRWTLNTYLGNAQGISLNKKPIG